MAALSVSCIQQHEFAGEKYLKSIMFLEQTYQNSLENCAKTLLGFTCVCSVCRPLAVGAGTCLMPPLAPDAKCHLHVLPRAASTCSPAQSRKSRDHCALVQMVQLLNFAPKQFGGWSNNKEIMQFLLELFRYHMPSLYTW